MSASDWRQHRPHRLATARETAMTREDSDRAAHLKGYRFKPGQSGNLAGRPRGSREFAELIAQETRGGAELVDYALNVLRSPKSKTAGKQWAVEYLTDRMLGRTPQASNDEKRNAFAFFQPMTPEQVALAEQMVRALPENTDGNPNGNGSD
jgi:hypothetical protein